LDLDCECLEGLVATVHAGLFGHMDHQVHFARAFRTFYGGAARAHAPLQSHDHPNRVPALPRCTATSANPRNGDLRAWLTARDIKFDGRQRIAFELDHKEKEAFQEQFKIRLP
jgi:hypothetical protein